MKIGDLQERSESAVRDKKRGIYRLHKHREYNSNERNRERYYEHEETPQKHERNQNDRHQK